MNDTPQRCPLIDAIDIPRIAIDTLSLDDLNSHYVLALETLAGLNEIINSHGYKSANEKQNPVRLARNLSLHLLRVRALIDAYKASASMFAKGQSSQATNAPNGAGHLVP
jgi:hypothetical protein